MADEINTANDGALRDPMREKAAWYILKRATATSNDEDRALYGATTRKDPGREPGHYWARPIAAPEDFWEVWQWDGNVWWGPGYPTPSTKDFFAEIGEMVNRSSELPSYEDRLTDGSLGDYMADRA